MSVCLIKQKQDNMKYIGAPPLQTSKVLLHYLKPDFKFH